MFTLQMILYEKRSLLKKVVSKQDYCPQSDAIEQLNIIIQELQKKQLP